MLNAVGCKMNDTSYPFRGEYKLEDCINHGHSGVVKRPPTSMLLRISGSNLVIEQLKVPSNLQLACELGVDGSVPRAVTLDTDKQSSLVVPGDGREYQLTAVIKGEGGVKHYCRMSFNGSEGRSTMRLRAPEGAASHLLQIFVDGKPLTHLGGWYVIPLHAGEVRLVLNISQTNDFASHAYKHLRDPLSGEGHSLPPLAPLISNQQEPRTVGSKPPSFILQTVPGAGKNAVLVCTATGQSIHLTENEAVTVSGGCGPYQLQLPTKGGLYPVEGITVQPMQGIPAGVSPDFTSLSAAPLGCGAGAEVPPAQPLDMDARAHRIDGAPAFTVSVASHYVQLTTDKSTVSGFGTAMILLPNGLDTSVQIVITDSNGRVVLRQRQHLPTQQAAVPALSLDIQDDPRGVILRGPPGSHITVGDGAQQPGYALVETARGLQTAVVVQPNADGTTTSAKIAFSAKSPQPPTLPAGMVASPTANPFLAATPLSTSVGAPAVSAPLTSAVSDLDPWASSLAQALSAANPDEVKRLLHQVIPTTPTSTIITNFIKDHLIRDVPVISFAPEKDSIGGIRCHGFNVSARVGLTQVMVPPNGSVQCPPGSRVVLTAVHPTNGRPVAGCEMQLGTSLINPVAASPLDDPFISHLIDSLQRHNMDPQKVADELSTIPGANLSSVAQRLVPLLVNCFRHLRPDPSQENIFITCGNGFLENVYTLQPHYQIAASLDSAPLFHVPQRGRIPATGTLTGGQPHFVKLIATDPISGSMRSEMSLTVFGPSPSPLHSPRTSHAAISPRVGKIPSQSLQPPPPQLAPMHATTTASSDHMIPGPTSFSEDAHAKIPYLDVSLVPAGPDLEMRFVSRPEQRLICDVDGVGGDTGRSDFIAKVAGSRSHRVELSLVDPYGRVVFQQRFEVPAMSLPHWGVAIQDNGLSVDPDSGCVSTVAVDRTAERSLQGNFLSLDMTIPHFLVLRKYMNGLQGQSAGELALRLPAFISPNELEELAQLYRLHLAGTLPEAALRDRLGQLQERSRTPAMGDLIQVLVESLGSGTGAGPLDISSSSGKVYFRLTGTD